MAEEAKKSAFNIKSLLKMLLGVVVILLGVCLTVKYFCLLKTIFLGCIGPFLILVGLIIVAIAKE